MRVIMHRACSVILRREPQGRASKDERSQTWGLSPFEGFASRSRLRVTASDRA